MREPFFIVGPTAVGKTGIAVAAAELCGAEIVSADAFQVYAGLDRLTAKPLAEQLARVRHRLIGHVPLSETYSVARYRQEAVDVLQKAGERGRPLIVVGGSGLYVKALTHGLSTLPAAQPELRAELEDVELPELVARLRGHDPVAAERIDTLNKRRVIRALEVCIATGGRFSDQQTAWRETRPPVRGVFLVREREDLLQRIDQRTDALLDDESLEQTRHALQGPLSDTASRIIGLSETGAFLAGEITAEACLERIRTATRRYAKRQLTWFRGESFDELVHLSPGENPAVPARMIAKKIEADRSGN